MKTIVNQERLCTILLVDNDRDFLYLTQEFLENQGYRVLIADCPDRARYYLARETIGVAIIDYRLRDDKDEYDESGLRLAEECTMPVIILTRFKEHEYVRRALMNHSGRSIAADYLVKQNDYSTLIEALPQIVGNTRVFLSYTRHDKVAVEKLYTDLSAVGIIPWMDTKDIVGGEKWEIAIRRAIRASDFFILCLSSHSVSRRGFIQREIRLALEILDEMLDEDIYLIPLRIEVCVVSNNRLQSLQWIDMFLQDGFPKLLEAIRIGNSRRT